MQTRKIILGSLPHYLKIDMYQELMPNFKKQDKCWEHEQIEVVTHFRKPIIKKDGTQLITAFPDDKPVNQIKCTKNF